MHKSTWHHHDTILDYTLYQLKQIDSVILILVSSILGGHFQGSFVIENYLFYLKFCSK